MCFVDQLAHALDRVRQRRLASDPCSCPTATIVLRRRGAALQALVVAQADRHRLVAAVHRHEVDVDVDDQVALGGAAVDLDRARRASVLPSVTMPSGSSGVVVVVAVGVVRVEDLRRRPSASSPQSFIRRCSELAMMMCTSSTPWSASISSTISSIVCADVGRAHRRQRQRDVVDGDGDLHARARACACSGSQSSRVVQRVADRRARVGEPLDRAASGR